MKSLILLSILLTACGTDQSNEAVADKITQLEVPSASGSEATDSNEGSEVVSAEIPEVSTEVTPAVEPVVTVPAVNNPVPAPAPVLLKTRTCATYGSTDTSFSIITKFYSDFSRMHTVHIRANGSGPHDLLAPTTLTQQLTGAEAVNDRVDIFIPMSASTVQAFGLSGANNLWRIELYVQALELPNLYYGAKQNPNGSSVEGTQMFFGLTNPNSGYSCRVVTP